MEIKIFQSTINNKKGESKMKISQNKIKDQKAGVISTKQNKFANNALTACMLTVLAVAITSDASAAGTAVQLDFVDNLQATVKELMQGAGSFVIDAIILMGGGWATARTSTPAPIILAILSVFIFEICIKLITK
jgi:hypothetical protein